MRDAHKHNYIGNAATYLLSIACVIAAAAWATPAAPGDLDPTFGNGGTLADWYGEARSVAIQADGKYVVAGTQIPFRNIAVARYNPDGSSDGSFGIGGKVRVTMSAPPFGSFLTAYGFAIQQNGKIVVACDDDDQGIGGLVRLNKDGTLDNSFGAGGVVFSGSLRSVSIQTDGKIVASGEGGLRRHNTDGSLDTSFGKGGILELPGSFHANIILPDGKILTAGGTYSGQYFVVRCHPNGSLDTTFGFNGAVVTPIGSSWHPAHSIATQTDGKLVVAGSSALGYESNLMLVRYNSNGSLDQTFGGTGIVASPIRTGYRAGKAMHIQPDGKIVASGWITGSTADFASVRYNANGTIDSTFGGGDGISTFELNTRATNDGAFGMELDSQGRAVVVGISWNGSNTQFALARLLLCDITSRNCI